MTVFDSWWIMSPSVVEYFRISYGPAGGCRGEDAPVATPGDPQAHFADGRTPRGKNPRQPMRILAIIPARGGSKGVPGKNIRPLGGKPLLAYSIEAALGCALVERVIVSTESPEIAAVAVRYGAEVPFLRPLELAGDQASLDSVIGNTLLSLEMRGYIPQAHIVLQPTSPFRSRGLMDFLCGRLAAGHRAVSTVRPVRLRRPCRLEPSGRLTPLARGGDSGLDQTYYRRYGLVGGSYKHGPRPSYAHVVNDPFMLIDIDTMRDMRLAEAVLRAEAFDFNGTGAGYDPGTF